MSKCMVIGKNKREGYTHMLLGNALRDAGLDCYNVTPGHIPARSRLDLRLLINHGVSSTPVWDDSIPHECVRLNGRHTVLAAANKVMSQQLLRSSDVPHLAYTTNKFEAESWLEQGKSVVVRHQLNSFQGRGIEILRPGMAVPEAELYTELFEGRDVREYRVYIVDKRAVTLRQKQRYRSDRLREMGIDPDDEYKKLVRAHKNGWVFAGNIKATNQEIWQVKCLAEQAAQVFDLGYGGVDIITERNSDGEVTRYAVVEVNTNIAVYDTNIMASIVTAIKEVYDNA